MEDSNVSVSPILKFNWPLLIGLTFIAISIFAAGHSIATRMPHTFHGHMSGHITGGGESSAPRDFMSEWEAASFLSMNHDELLSIMRTGELNGTYTIFQVERREWFWPERGDINHGNPNSVMLAPAPVFPNEVSMEYIIISSDHIVFSRERLSEWLLSRIDNN